MAVNCFSYGSLLLLRLRVERWSSHWIGFLRLSYTLWAAVGAIELLWFVRSYILRGAKSTFLPYTISDLRNRLSTTIYVPVFNSRSFLPFRWFDSLHLKRETDVSVCIRVLNYLYWSFVALYRSFPKSAVRVIVVGGLGFPCVIFMRGVLILFSLNTFSYPAKIRLENSIFRSLVVLSYRVTTNRLSRWVNVFVSKCLWVFPVAIKFATGLFSFYLGYRSMCFIVMLTLFLGSQKETVLSSVVVRF